MKTGSTLGLALIAAALATTALAQQSGTTEAPGITSEPGRVKAVRTAELSAKVEAVDAAKRTVTLKSPDGDTMTVVAGDEVKNFAQIKVGDSVVARYTQALELELRKTKAAGDEVSVREQATRAAPGERPAAASEREITATADVIAVDPEKSTITLKGPRGNVVVLDVKNPDQFKVVHKGDQVDVTYTEALALSVEPGAK